MVSSNIYWRDKSVRFTTDLIVFNQTYLVPYINLRFVTTVERNLLEDFNGVYVSVFRFGYSHRYYGKVGNWVHK